LNLDNKSEPDEGNIDLETVLINGVLSLFNLKKIK
jgi:hypothetical protein